MTAQKEIRLTCGIEENKNEDQIDDMCVLVNVASHLHRVRDFYRIYSSLLHTTMVSSSVFTDSRRSVVTSKSGLLNEFEKDLGDIQNGWDCHRVNFNDYNTQLDAIVEKISMDTLEEVSELRN